MGNILVLKSDGSAFTLKDKNAEILERLQETIAVQKEKQEASSGSKKGAMLKFGAAVNNKLLELFRSYGLMPEGLLENLEAEDLQEYYLAFLELMNTVSRDIDLTPTKPLFCAYMGITTKIFNSLERGRDPYIRNWIDAINGDFAHSLFDSTMNGNASEKAALAYVATKDYGQEAVQNAFSATIITKNENEFTPQQALDFAQNIKKMITGGAEDKKKKGKRG